MTQSPPQRIAKVRARLAICSHRQAEVIQKRVNNLHTR